MYLSRDCLSSQPQCLTVAAPNSPCRSVGRLSSHLLLQSHLELRSRSFLRFRACLRSLGGNESCISSTIAHTLDGARRQLILCDAHYPWPLHMDIRMLDNVGELPLFLGHSIHVGQRGCRYLFSTVLLLNSVSARCSLCTCLATVLHSTKLAFYYPRRRVILDLRLHTVSCIAGLDLVVRGHKIQFLALPGSPVLSETSYAASTWPICTAAPLVDGLLSGPVLLRKTSPTCNVRRALSLLQSILHILEPCVVDLCLIHIVMRC